MTLTMKTMNMKTTDTNIKLLQLGTDIIEIERIRSSWQKHQDIFLSKIFSQEEKEYCFRHKDPAPHLAARFAAKEAVAKALGVGFGQKLSFLDITIAKDVAGKPIVSLSSRAMRLFPLIHIEISLSHCKSFATATAIAYTITTEEKKE
jgi:holo-[acyl-carrier protein] synthase